MINLTLTMLAHSNKRREFLSTCRLIFDRTRDEKGCLGCHLFQDVDNENLIHLEQTWAHRAGLDDHLRSNLFSALLGAMKLLGESHSIRIDDGSEVDGLEAVTRARSTGGKHTH